MSEFWIRNIILKHRQIFDLSILDKIEKPLLFETCELGCTNEEVLIKKNKQ